MNREESVTKHFLETLQMGDVEYEPDGNIPPDFSVASTTGVEVRRLNENYFRSIKATGLEELLIPFLAKLRKMLKSFDGQFDGHSYWIGTTYKRPLPGGIKGTCAEIQQALELFLRNPRATPCEIKINNMVWIDIYPSTPSPNHVFRHGISSDDDSGGPVVQMYSRNISFCVEEKKKKITPYKARYQQWWLVLVDTMMSWQLMPHEVEQVRAAVTNGDFFDKVILIDYFGKTTLLEID